MIFEGKKSVHKTPRLSVRTIGRQTWTVTVRKKEIAERVQSRFRRQGLHCGQIEAGQGGFVFTVDGRSETNLDGDRPVGDAGHGQAAAQ